MTIPKARRKIVLEKSSFVLSILFNIAITIGCVIFVLFLLLIEQRHCSMSRLYNALPYEGAGG